jgi:hypothetical protein
VDGGVSIAVRLTYSGKQAGVPFSDLFQEPEETVGYVEYRARSPVDMSSKGVTITVRTARILRSFRGGAPCPDSTVTQWFCCSV